MFSFRRDNDRSCQWDSVPQKNANGRVIELVSGKSLGGATKINAMLYNRGAPAQYNAWAAAGRKGWSYDDIEPYFVKSEHHLGIVSETSQDFHGVLGKLMPVRMCSFLLNVLNSKANGRTGHTLHHFGDILRCKRIRAFIVLRYPMLIHLIRTALSRVLVQWACRT